MSLPRIAVIVGSIREGRFADKPAEWIVDLGRARSDVSVELVDLRDYPLPLLAEESPLFAESKSEVARRWQKKLLEFDGFIFTAAEYNHGPTGVLKNAIDYAGLEWRRKPAAFVGYGGVGGARAISQLRLSVIQLQMAAVPTAVNIAWTDVLAVNAGKRLAEFPHLQEAAVAMFDDLAWWANALKRAFGAPTQDAAMVA